MRRHVGWSVEAFHAAYDSYAFQCPCPFMEGLHFQCPRQLKDIMLRSRHEDSVFRKSESLAQNPLVTIDHVYLTVLSPIGALPPRLPLWPPPDAGLWDLAFIRSSSDISRRALTSAISQRASEITKTSKSNPYERLDNDSLRNDLGRV